MGKLIFKYLKDLGVSQARLTIDVVLKLSSWKAVMRTEELFPYSQYGKQKCY